MIFPLLSKKQKVYMVFKVNMKNSLLSANTNERENFLAPFILSLAFLPLPVLLGGSALREILTRLQQIAVYGWGPGDALLIIGMMIGMSFLIVIPLIAFACGQVLAWSGKAYAFSTIAVYASLAFAYSAAALLITRSALI